MSDFIELPQIQISNPCHEDWESMDGSERTRHCASCEKSVLNLSEMTSHEVREVVCSGKSVCVRLQRNADGSIVTKDTSKTAVARIGFAATLLTSLTLAGCAKESVETPEVGGSATAPPVQTTTTEEFEMGDFCLPEEATEEQVPSAIMGRVDQH